MTYHDHLKDPSSILETFLGMLILGFVIFLAWASWPISLYAAIGFFLCWVFHSFSQKMRAPEALPDSDFSHSPETIHPFMRFIISAFSVVFYAIYRALFWMTIGIVLVCLLQMFLSFTPYFVAPETVIWIEDQIALGYEYFKDLFTLESLFQILLILFAVTLFAPRAQMVSKFLFLKRLISITALILLGASSFTFFSALQADSLYNKKFSKLKYEARFKLNQIKKHQRDLVSAAWVEMQMQQLSSERKSEYENLFKTIENSTLQRIVIRDTVRVIVHGTRVLQALPKTAGDFPRVQNNKVINPKVEAFIDPKTAKTAAPVTYDELLSANKSLTAHELRLREARRAAIEVLTESVGELLPKAERRVVQAFLNQIVGSLSRHTLRNLSLWASNDMTSARGWVAKNIFSDSPTDIVKARGALNLATNALPLDDLPTGLHHVPFMPGSRPGMRPPRQAWEKAYMAKKAAERKKIFGDWPGRGRFSGGYKYPGSSGYGRGAAKGVSEGAEGALKILRFLK